MAQGSSRGPPVRWPRANFAAPRVKRGKRSKAHLVRGRQRRLRPPWTDGGQRWSTQTGGTSHDQLSATRRPAGSAPPVQEPPAEQPYAAPPQYAAPGQYAMPPQRPGMVTAAAVVMIVLGALVILLGLLFLIGGAFIGGAGSEIETEVPGFSGMAGAVAGVIIVLAVIFLAFGILNIVAGANVLGAVDGRGSPASCWPSSSASSACSALAKIRAAGSSSRCC